MLDARIPHRVFIDGIGFFKVAGENERKPVWLAQPVASELGEFERLRTVEMANPLAGFTGTHRHLSVQSPAGIADSDHALTDAEGIIGAGPKINTETLSLPPTIVGSIGMDLVIGAMSLSGGGTIEDPMVIWADGEDDDGSPARFTYVACGDHIFVLDPDNNHQVMEDHHYPGVTGWDMSRWLGKVILAPKSADGTASNVMWVEPRFRSTETVFTEGNFAAFHIVAGPDAMYFHLYSATNEALVKKSDATTLAGLIDSANLSPTNGETMGDPGVPITRLAVLGSRFVTGKEDGLGEFDTELNYRKYLPWMEAFRWDLQANGILPLGQQGDVLVTFRRGLYRFPANISVGLEVVESNDSDKRGRYTTLNYDGKFIYAALHSPPSEDDDPPEAAHLFKMRLRRTPGPGPYEHHHVDTIDDAIIKSIYIWPGATIGSTVYGPRVYYSGGPSAIHWYVLGETQPEIFDSERVWHTGEWSVTWSHDDFGSPETMKMPYRVGADYENVADTGGIRWQGRVELEDEWQDFTADGTPEGAAPVLDEGFARRFGPLDKSVRGRELQLRCIGTGGKSTAQQRMGSIPTFTFIEQPDKVQAIAATFQLEPDDQYNELDAAAQYTALEDAVGKGPFTMRAFFRGPIGLEEQEQAQVILPRVVRSSEVASADSSGVIFADVTIRALQYEDVVRA